MRPEWPIAEWLAAALQLWERTFAAAAQRWNRRKAAVRDFAAVDLWPPEHRSNGKRKAANALVEPIGILRRAAL